jgi:hydroxymethylbilane synthase
MKIRYGTRGSKLAITQARQVISTAKPANPQIEFEEVVIKTLGDQIKDIPLYQVGGQGLFIKEIEQALLENRIDIAVHSLKDMPHEMTEELCLFAVGSAKDPRDCFLSVNYPSFMELPKGAKIGTSSLRRRIQLKLLRDDLEFTDFRGNLDTRFQKLQDGEVDAIILATAGLLRLDWAEKIREHFSINNVIPSVGQGLIGLQCRAAQADEYRQIFAAFAEEKAMLRARAEREFLRVLQGGCKTPMAAHAEVDGEHMTLHSFYSDMEGKNTVKNMHSGFANKPEALGREAAEEILEMKDMLCKK